MKSISIGKRNITIATILFLVIFSWVDDLDNYSKNYTDKALGELPKMDEILLLQKTRNTYQVLFR